MFLLTRSRYHVKCQREAWEGGHREWCKEEERCRRLAVMDFECRRRPIGSVDCNVEIVRHPREESEPEEVQRRMVMAAVQAVQRAQEGLPPSYHGGPLRVAVTTLADSDMPTQQETQILFTGAPRNDREMRQAALMHKCLMAPQGLAVAFLGGSARSKEPIYHHVLMPWARGIASGAIDKLDFAVMLE